MGAAATAAAATAAGLLFRGGVRWFGFFLLAAALEVGGVPAAALEMEPGRGNQLLERGLAAGGTVPEYRIAHLLDGFQSVATGPTFILINRHTESPEKTRPQDYGGGEPDKQAGLYPGTRCNALFLKQCLVQKALFIAAATT